MTNANSLPARLVREGHRFDFYQAVRLLEMLQPTALSPGTGMDPEEEAVRFRSRISLEFPASDVHEIRVRPDQPPEMTVNFIGLAGLLGPLPMPITEMVLASPSPLPAIDENGQPRRDASAAADFLDIFNHRLISMMYRVRKSHRPALTSTTPAEGQIAKCLFSLIGLGVPSLRDRMALPDAALLLYSGMLVRRPRSAVGLQQLVSDYLGVPVRVRQFVGRWRSLDRRQWTIVGGKRQRNIRLGVSAVAGTRVWDEQTHVRLTLGPLTREKYMALLPGGGAHNALRDLVRFYVDPEISFNLVLVLRKEDVSPTEVGASDLLLGFTSWLSPAGVECGDQIVRVEGDY